MVSQSGSKWLRFYASVASSFLQRGVKRHRTLGSSSVRFASTMAEAPSRPIRGVVFDMDGTLTRPTMDWNQVRRKLGIADGCDILLFIQSLPSGSDKQSAALRTIREEEERAVQELVLRDHCVEMLAKLEKRGVCLGLLTRNCDNGVAALEKDIRKQQHTRRTSFFSQIVTRSFRPTKPSPEPLLHICKHWSLEPSQVVMVGDSRDDFECGREAGATTVIIRAAYNSTILESANHVIDGLDELIPVLESRLPAEGTGV